MTRTAYKNQHIREHYDRINLCIPKSEKAKIRAIADNMQIRLFRLICADLSGGESHNRYSASWYKRLIALSDNLSRIFSNADL